MSKIQSLIKDSAIYGISSIVGRFLNYLLVPLYTYTLKSLSDYGIVNDLYAMTAIVLVILTFGMETTFFRFMNKEERPMEVLSTTLIMVGGVALVFVTAVLALLPQVAAALGYEEHPWYIGMMAIIVGMDAFQAILFSYLRYKKRPIRFVTLKMLFILLSCTLNVLAYAIIPKFVDNWEITVTYTVVINLICTSMVMLCFIGELRECPWRFNKDYCRSMLAYTWPLLILGIAGILNQVAGQLMLPRVLPREEGRAALGIYGACVKVAMVMAMITQAFRYAYEPFVFSQTKERDSKETYALGMKFFIIFTLFAFICVIAYLPLLQRIVDEKYRVGMDIVPIVMAAEIMMGIYFNLSFWYKLIDKTIWGAIFSVCGCVVLIAVNYLFIPHFGYMACAWAGFAGYFTAMVLSYIVGQKKNKIDYDLKTITTYIVITVAMYFAMRYAMGLVDKPLPKMAIGTVFVVLFIAHVLYHDLPPKSIPFVGKYFDRHRKITNNNK